MNLTIAQADLAAAIARIVRVVERKNTIPILSNLLLTAAGEALTLTATDLDIEATTHAPASITAAGTTTLPAGVLADIVRKVDKGATITLTIDDTRATLRAGRSRFVLATLPPVDFPALAAGDLTHTFTLPAADLSRLIARTEHCVSTEETRYYLNGIFLHRRAEDHLAAVATDGHRLALATLPAPEGSADMPGVIIPRKTVGEIATLLKDAAVEPVNIALSAQKIRIQCGVTTLTSKLIDGTFPDYQRVIPSATPTTTADLPREDMAAAIERVATVASERGRGVRLTFGDAGLTLDIREGDTNAEDTLPIGHEGQDIVIGFNHAYLTGLLARIPGETARLAMTGPGNPALLTTAAEPDGLTVLMPMRT